MGIESVSFIEDLNAAWPLSNDPREEGDNHLRLLKTVLQANFPNLGNSVAVNPTAAELNHVVGVTSAIQTQLNTLTAAVALNTAKEGFEIGDIKLRPVATVGSNWEELDGVARDSVTDTTLAALFTLLGTTFGGTGAADFHLPPMPGRVVVGRGTGTAADATAHTLGDTGGTEGHTLTAAEMPTHTHSIANQGSRTDLVGGGSTSAATAGAGTSGSAGGDGAHNNLQPYTVLAYFIKKA